MIREASMYVPGWPGLKPGYFFGVPSTNGLPFPLNAQNKTYFYVARSGIYHLVRALGFQNGDTVLMPDYHSGVEVWAVRAAGARVRYYHINRNMEPDLDELRQLSRSNPRALFLIHYLGWPQPMKELMALCRERDMILIEDCALALLSEVDGQPLGSFGDYAIFCLYKTLPVPNGGLLVQNKTVLPALSSMNLKRCDWVSVVGRSAELMVEWMRGRSEPVGNALAWAKRAGGRALTALGVNRLPVGDISPDFRSPGYDVTKLNIGMSPLCMAMMTRFDYEAIRHKRRRNYSLMQEMLASRVPLGRKELPPGVCPLFFPLLVPDKRAAARALRERGVAAVELWNYGFPEAKGEEGRDARFLRDHVLELPIHQDVTPSQVEYVADQVLSLGLNF
ncbi:MAG: aminotransferase class V-fold PLP-dependent enzyme [Nitrospirae bacterium]|nr:MAG: aminotransferase class V-fold PLP-dependent enzyme [Nitrospirota bacterium]